MAGRPKRVFTEEEKAKIEQMALDNCHVDTIALALSISKNTLIRHYGTFISQKRAFGRTELAHAQREKAIVGKDSTMLIWRGKQDLGQKDRQEHIHGVTDDLGALLTKIGKSDDLRPESDKE